jgi:hypothetical protein
LDAGVIHSVRSQLPIRGKHADHRAAVEALVAAVTRAIDEADPKSLLEFGAPSDEYSSEVGAITPRVAKAASRDEVRLILHEEFERWFGVGSVGSIEAFEPPANAIWQAVLVFRHTV